jgi:hypothetical protein
MAKRTINTMKMDTYNKAMSESQITDPFSMDVSLMNFKNLISQAPVLITIFEDPIL